MFKKLKILIIVYLVFYPFYALNQNIDSLVNIINSEYQDSLKAKAYLSLAENYFDNADTAVYFYNKCIEYAKKDGNKILEFKALSDVYVLYLDNSDYINAKKMAYGALETAKELNDSLIISQALNNVGNIYMYLELYEEALKYFMDAINIYPIEKNPREAGKLYGRLGNLYLYIDDYINAEKAYKRALPFFEKADFKNGIIIATQNLGVIEKRKENFEKALEYYHSALEGYRSVGYRAGMAQCQANIGNIYSELKNYTKALQMLKDALVIFTEENQMIDEIVCNSEIAEVYIKSGQTKKALSYAHHAEKLLEALPKNDKTKLMVLRQLEQIYVSRKDTSIAYRYLLAYQSLNDTILKHESQERIDLLKIQYDFGQKEKDIQLLTIENELKEAELKRKSQFQILYIILIGISVLAFFVTLSLFRTKKKANIALELKNAEILQQKEEIESQRDEIEAQRDMVYSQKLDLEAVHSKISQSIDYAKLIQSSILPDPLVLNERIADYFVLYKPKDVVSGDFYWWAKVENKLIIAAVDCTGHGVPGAFMSMLGISFLREIVMKEYVTHPGVILRKLRKEVIRSLKQSNELGSTRDGMDMALVNIDLESKKIQYAGANNPLYIVSKNAVIENDKVIPYQLDGLEEKLYEVKPDKMPISIYHKLEPFTNHEIQLQKGDKLYLFSDGFIDQFGSADGKRFMYSNFRNLLLTNSQKDFQQQSKVLDDTFETWKGDKDQIDDVLIVGLEL